MGFFPFTYAVFGIMRDKDVDAVIAALKGRVDHWLVAALPGPRAASPDWIVERLRLADDEPTIVSTSHLRLPAHVVLTPAQLHGQASLWRVLRSQGVTFARSEATIQAVEGSVRESELLEVQPGSPLDHFLHLIMPVSVLTFFYMATWSRFVRSSMLEVLRQDYVRTARAKGLYERVVIIKHTLRNALIPFVTIAVLTIPSFFAGAIITETVFAWPGMGRLYFDALNRSDWNVALAFIFITALLTVIATLIGDILYTVVDPRIKFS